MDAVRRAGVVLRWCRHLGGVAISVWRAFHVVARERLIGLAILVVPIALAGSMSGLALLVIIDVLLIAILIAEHVRIEGRPGARVAT